MTLSRKILVGVSVAMAAILVGATATVYILAGQNREQAIHERLTSVLSQAEITQVNMDRMHQAGAFDIPHLLDLAQQQVGGGSLKSNYDKTDFYHTVPVVASWETIRETADKLGYKFEISGAAPGRARNPQHDRAAQYAEALEAVRARSRHPTTGVRTANWCWPRPCGSSPAA